MAALLPPICLPALSLDPACAQLQCLGSSQYLFMCKTVGESLGNHHKYSHFSSQFNLKERIQSVLKSQEHLLRQLLGTSSQICILKLTAAPDAHPCLQVGIQGMKSGNHESEVRQRQREHIQASVGR